MAGKKNDKGFADIRTYAELETTLRMLRRQEEINGFSRGVISLGKGASYQPQSDDSDLHFTASRTA